MEETGSGKSIAVVGAGVAGIVAAYILSRKHAVTLIEKNNYIGGHTNTIVVQDEKEGAVDVDTGFIVCNPTNYPYFYRFLDQLGVPRRDSEMSFGFFSEKSGVGYKGPRIREFLSQPANFLKRSFVKMLFEQQAFNKRALVDLEQGALEGMSLGAYLSTLGCSDYFKEHYLFPLAGAIWSSPDEDINDFPALMFINFFRNHGMLELSNIPRWQTVVGSSYAYVKAFEKIFKGQMIKGDPVVGIKRETDKVAVSLQSGVKLDFDYAVMASHADQSLRMLEDASEAEAKLLGAWRYHDNETVLHTDENVMPKKRSLWASWNYYRSSDTSGREPVSITYYMNRLQGLKLKRDFFVTLNRMDKIDPDKIIYHTNYHHPVYTTAALASQPGIRELNGENRTFYCGSYMRYGFHEDAVGSAVAVANKFGMEL
ncbi:FAD-dependent oxidoreductase [Oligoflexia bacterium]|nr:FAD-dependent oxidoreductase [Oligoflexia bacterium]